MIIKKKTKVIENDYSDNFSKLLNESLNYYKTHKTLNSRRRFPMDPLFSIFPRNSLDFVPNGVSGGDSIFIQNTYETSNIKELLNRERFENKNVLIKGVSGIGKSHSIYQIVVEIRNGLFEIKNPNYIESSKPNNNNNINNNNNNRCVYIPDYGNWFKYENEREANFLFIFSIFIAYEINNDKFVTNWWKKDFIKSIKKLSIFSSSTNNSGGGGDGKKRNSKKKSFTFENILLFLKDLSNYNKSKELNFFIFFDQHTPITKTLINSKKTKFPYNLPEIIQNLIKCDLVVVSISEGKNQPLVNSVNNNNNNQNSWTIFSMNVGFQFNEFLEWRSFYLNKFKNNISWLNNQYFHSKICYTTNMIPGELNYFISNENKFKNNSKGLFDNYYSNRYREYKEDLEIVFKKLTDEQKVLFERSMVLLELMLPIDNEKILILSQFMVKQYLPEEPCFHKKGGYSIIRAKSPIALTILKEKLTDVYQSFLSEFIEKIFSIGFNYYSRDICFNAAKIYLSNKILDEKDFRLKTIFTDNEEFPKFEYLRINLIRTVHLYDFCFDDSAINWNYSFIMLPHSITTINNYNNNNNNINNNNNFNFIHNNKDIEFYIWDAVYLRFFIVQNTLKLNSERDTFKTLANKSIWSEILKNKEYNENDTVHYLYIGPETLSSITYNYITSFEHISETFPLFAKISNEWMEIQ
ncbi:hypothetical protein ACTFIY_004442 [Dictyostelium cf. discoideum]